MAICTRAVALLVALAVVLDTVRGHGALVDPPPRNAVDRVLPEFQNGQFPAHTVGCNCGQASGCPAGRGVRAAANGQACLWFTQGTTIGCSRPDNQTQHTNKSLCANPTTTATLNDPRLRTVNLDAEAGGPDDVYRWNPWRAPGSAPVVDACGMAGGAPVAGGGAAEFAATPFARQGDLGSVVLQPVPEARTWARNSTVQVAFGLRFNHGGGVSYRLCPSDQPLTETCFQKYPLKFSDKRVQTLQWTNGSTQDIPAVIVDVGTTPPGSQWARNPIPRINFDSVSSGQPPSYKGCEWPAKGAACREFDPPCKGDSGWHPVNPANPGDVDVEGECSGDATGLQIIDSIVIPADLAPGPYVLGWRWDCEETAQVGTQGLLHHFRL